MVRGGWFRAWFAVVFLATTLGVTASAEAWSARKSPKTAVHKSRPKKAGKFSKVRGQPRVSATPTSGKFGNTLQALRRHVANRDMQAAQAVAEALLATRRVRSDMLAEAATALGSGADVDLLQRLWQRALAGSRGSAALRRQNLEGFVDTLLAQGGAARAREMLGTAIAKAARGTRRTLLDRLVAAAKLDASTGATIDTLRALHDPDAAILAAELLEESGETDASAEELAAAWKAFPGHRALQAAYQTLLVRMGRREDLGRVIAQVVRLAPADPMPFLALLDAHIAARDTDAARTLIDDLAHKYPKNDVMLEALVDREQRLGESVVRVTALYTALLAAAPKESPYIEAYAEWLLSRPLDKTGAGDTLALGVLERLQKPPFDPLLGLEKGATILLGHNRYPAARKLVLAMDQRQPGDARVTRLLAMLDEKEGRLEDAAAKWRQLTQFAVGAPLPERQRAEQARLTLGVLLRRMQKLEVVTAAVRAQVEAKQASLPDVLLWLALQSQLEDGKGALPDAAWQNAAQVGLRAYPTDTELTIAVASGLLSRGHLHEALPAIDALVQLAPDTVAPVALSAVELSLALGQTSVTTRLEAVLEQATEGIDTATLLRLGDLHLRHGDNTGATAMYRRANARGTQDTRAVGRLATLFRLSGATDDEDRALRDIVARAIDGDEIDLAGQRLLAVALGAGRLGELVRWLDSIVPQHARRELVERLRMTGYDLWLRAHPLEDALGKPGPEPVAAGVGDALSSGDLSQQIKALRQLAQLRRPIAPALATQLLGAANPSLRRDVTLLLGASGSPAATQLLVSVIDGHDPRINGGLDPDEEVRMAQLAALAQLPPVPGVERVLSEMLSQSERSGDFGAALVLARVAGPLPMLPRLGDLVATGNRAGLPAALVALGALAGRHGHEPAARDAVDRLLQFSPARPGTADYPRQTAALWALAASGQARAMTDLWKVALESPERPLRAMAVRLLAADKPPTIVVPTIQSAQGDTGGDLRNRILRATLLPWLADDPAALGPALRALDVELARSAHRRTHMAGFDAWRTQWCAGWVEEDGGRLAGPQVREFCGMN